MALATNNNREHVKMEEEMDSDGSKEMDIEDSEESDVDSGETQQQNRHHQQRSSPEVEVEEVIRRLRAESPRSPCVTGRIYQSDGMAELGGITLDSGCNTGIARISRKIVQAARLTIHPYGEPPTAYGIAGVKVTVSEWTRFNLTVAGATINIFADVDPEGQPSPYSILLGMNHLHALGIEMLFTTFPVTVYRCGKDGRRIYLPIHNRQQGDWAEWYDIDSSDYIAALLDDPAVHFPAIVDGEIEVSPGVKDLALELKGNNYQLQDYMEEWVNEYRGGSRRRPSDMEPHEPPSKLKVC